MTDKAILRVTGRDDQGRFLPGNAANLKHGAFAYLFRGRLPRVPGKRALSRRLDELRLELEEAVQDLSPQKRVLISQVVRLQGFLELTELYLKAVGPLRPDKLRRGLVQVQPIMERWYLTAMNSQRLSLMALGLDRKPEPVPTFAEIVKRIDEAKAKAATAGIDEKPSGGTIDATVGVGGQKNDDEEKAMPEPRPGREN